MTQIQRRNGALLTALGSLLFSFGFWTAVLGNVQLSSAGSGPVSGIWQGFLGSAGGFVGKVTQSVDNTFHEAASAVAEVVSPVADLDESGFEPVPATPSFSSDQHETDTAKWEVRQTYALAIPSIGVQAPVLTPSRKYWDRREWNLLEKQMQVGLAYGTVVYPHSVRPGGKGTVFLAGHSSPPNGLMAESKYGNIFARVPELKRGDDIEIVVGGETLRYRVRSSEVVSPSATEILLQQREESLLKIITCFPVGTTKNRIIVTAVLLTGEF